VLERFGSAVTPAQIGKKILPLVAAATI